MTPTRASGLVHAIASRVVAITAVLCIVLVASPARADAVDSLIRQLESSSDKVRLSAALNLTKLGDAKAILPLVKTLSNDDDANVRGAAAVGLGKLVTRSTRSSIRNLAISALKRAAGSDSSTFVKSQSTKALTALGASGSDDSGGPSTSGGSSAYVNIGPMSSKTGDKTADARLRPLMAKVATQTMARKASTMITSWAGGKDPSKRQLAAKGFQGFYVDGTLNELTVTTSGRTATISCKISMLLASYPDKSVFGFLNGGAKVQGSASASEVALASDDCVAAVVEDLIAKKIVPTIKSRMGSP